MKITVTGSLGHISKPLTEELVRKGHSVTVISSKPEKQNEIEALGAAAAIGTIEDVHFLTSAFKGADVVYTMLPPPDFSNPNLDFMGRAEKVGHNYVQAVQEAGAKRLIHLSSVGAHTDKGNGILRWAHNLENILRELPPNISITFMRPVGFYYNLLSFIHGVKAQGVIASNYGADDIIPWVSPSDIATTIAEEIETPFAGRKICYVASDELSCNEAASILGTQVGMPDLKWIVIPNEQLLSGMKAFGLNESLAEGFVEMNAAMHSGTLFEDYYRCKPGLGKVKMTDFAKDFGAAFLTT